MFSKAKLTPNYEVVRTFKPHLRFLPGARMELDADRVLEDEDTGLWVPESGMWPSF